MNTTSVTAHYGKERRYTYINIDAGSRAKSSLAIRIPAFDSCSPILRLLHAGAWTTYSNTKFCDTDLFVHTHRSPNNGVTTLLIGPAGPDEVQRPRTTSWSRSCNVANEIQLVLIGNLKCDFGKCHLILIWHHRSVVPEVSFRCLFFGNFTAFVMSWY